MKMEKQNKLKKLLVAKIDHYCFDLDGTLVDSNKTIYEATAFTSKKVRNKL